MGSEGLDRRRQPCPRRIQLKLKSAWMDLVFPTQPGPELARLVGSVHAFVASRYVRLLKHVTLKPYIGGDRSAPMLSCPANASRLASTSTLILPAST